MRGRKYFPGWFNYVTCCVNARGEDIEKMVDAAIEVTYRTFIKHVHLRDLNDMFGYGPAYGSIMLCDDHHVRYFRSKYRGRKCYYVVHSAIEYVFC